MITVIGSLLGYLGRDDAASFRVLAPELTDLTRDKVSAEDADYLFLWLARHA